jgi:hypothetical protein
MLLNRTKSSYIRVGLWGETQHEALAKTKSFIVKNRSHSSLIAKMATTSPLKKSQFNRKKSNPRPTAEEPTDMYQTEANFKKIQKSYNWIFLIIEKHLWRRKKNDKSKKENFKRDNKILFKEISKEIDMMLIKYGRRRTELIYEAISSKRQKFFNKIETSIDQKTQVNYQKFKALINQRFKHSFTFAIDLFKTEDKILVAPTDPLRNHPIFGESNQFMREIIFSDFIDHSVFIENFIDTTFDSYNKDLANLTERIKFAKQGDVDALESIKNLLRKYLKHLNFSFNLKDITIPEKSHLKVNERMFNDYFTSRFDYRLNNLKMAYMFYQIYKKLGQETRALTLIMKAIDANISTISTYLEFYIKYFQIYNYITELFPSYTAKNFKEDPDKQKNEEAKESANDRPNSSSDLKDPEGENQNPPSKADPSESDNDTNSKSNTNLKINAPDRQKSNQLDNLRELESIAPIEKNVNSIDFKQTENMKNLGNQIFKERESVLRDRFKENDDANPLKRVRSASRKRAKMATTISDTNLFEDPEKSKKRPLTFPEFFKKIVYHQTRYIYICDSYKYLMSIFSPAEMKEMLFEVAEHAMREKHFAKAEAYFTYIIYMFENIDVFELYKNKLNKEETFASTKENIQRIYNILKLNERLFFVNNYYISICIRTKNFSKALVFIINNHYIYKNSMKLIDERDPCKYAKKNPNTIILQSFSDYHLDIEEKILFQKLFNFFKENYTITLEHHKVLWNKIKLNQNEVSAGLFCHFRDILDKLEALYSHDRKSYIELLKSIKIKREIQAEVNPYSSSYVPFYLGYMKKKDHLKYITSKIFKINDKHTNTNATPHAASDRKRFNMSNPLRLEMKNFIQDTCSYQKKRENQIKENDILNYLDIRNENDEVIDLVFRRGLKHNYDKYRISLYFDEFKHSLFEWIKSNWHEESVFRFQKNVRILTSKMKKHLMARKEQKRTQLLVKDDEMRPLALKKSFMAKIRNRPVMYINEFKKRFLPKIYAESQFLQNYKEEIIRVTHHNELEFKEIIPANNVAKARIRKSSFDGNRNMNIASNASNLAKEWKLSRRTFINPHYQDSNGSFKLKKSHNSENVSELNNNHSEIISNSSKGLNRNHKFEEKRSSLKKGISSRGRGSGIILISKRRQNYYKNPKYLSERNKLRQYFKDLKDTYEKTYVDQVHSISKISEMPFTFNDIKLLNSDQISVNFYIDHNNNDSISLKVSFSNLKFHLNNNSVTLMFSDKAVSINEILQQTLKETNFKFYTIIPVLHKFLVKEYFLSNFYNKSTFKYKNTKYEKQIQEYLKKMGLVYSLILIEFDKIKLDYLRNLQIGLYNKFDLCYLQAFFFIIKYLTFFLNKAKKRSPLGVTNINNFRFVDLYENVYIRDNTANIYVTSIYVEKLLFYSIKKQTYNRLNNFSLRKMIFDRNSILDLQKDFVLNLTHLLENLITSIYVHKVFHQKSNDKENVKVFLGCRVERINDVFVNITVYATYDLKKLEEIASQLVQKIEKLRKKLNKLETNDEDEFLSQKVPGEEDLFQVLLIKIAKKVIKFTISVKPIGGNCNQGYNIPMAAYLEKKAGFEANPDKRVSSKMEEFNKNLRININHLIFMCICPEQIESGLDRRFEDQFFSALFLKRHFIESLIIDMFVFPFESKKVFEIFQDCFDQMTLGEYIIVVKKKKLDLEVDSFRFDYKKLFRSISVFAEFIDPFIQRFFLFPKNYNDVKIQNYTHLIAFYETIVQEGVHKKILSKRFQNITIAINNFFEKSVKNIKKNYETQYNTELMSKQHNMLLGIASSNNKSSLLSEKTTLFSKNFPNVKREMQLMIYMRDNVESMAIREEEAAAKKRRASKLITHKLKSQQTLILNQSFIEQNKAQGLNLKIMDDQKFQIIDEAETNKMLRNFYWTFTNGELYVRYYFPSVGHKLRGSYVTIRGQAKPEFFDAEKVCFLSNKHYYMCFLESLVVSFYNPRDKWPLKFIQIGQDDLREVCKIIQNKSLHFEIEFFNRLLKTHILMKESHQIFSNNIFLAKPFNVVIPELFPLSKVYSVDEKVNLLKASNSNQSGIDLDTPKIQLKNTFQEEDNKSDHSTEYNNQYKQFPSTNYLFMNTSTIPPHDNHPEDEKFENSKQMSLNIHLLQTSGHKQKRSFLNTNTNELGNLITPIMEVNNESFSTFRSMAEDKMTHRDDPDNSQLGHSIRVSQRNSGLNIQNEAYDRPDASQMSYQEKASHGYGTLKIEQPKMSSNQDLESKFFNQTVTQTNLHYELFISQKQIEDTLKVQDILKDSDSIIIKPKSASLKVTSQNEDNDNCYKDTEIIIKKDGYSVLYDGLNYFNHQSAIECLWDSSALFNQLFKVILLTNNSSNFNYISEISKFECFTTKLVRDVRDIGLCEITIEVILYDPLKWARNFAILNKNKILSTTQFDQKQTHFYNCNRKMNFINSNNFNYFEALLYQRLYQNLIQYKDNFAILFGDISRFFCEDEIFFVKMYVDPVKYKFTDYVMIMNNNDFVKFIEPQFWMEKIFKNTLSFSEGLAEFECHSYKSFFILFMENLVDNIYLQNFRNQKKLCVKVALNQSLDGPTSPRSVSEKSRIPYSESSVHLSRNSLKLAEQSQSVDIFIGNYDDAFPTDYSSQVRGKFLKNKSSYIKVIGSRSVNIKGKYIIFNYKSYSLFGRVICEAYYPNTCRRCLFQADYSKIKSVISRSINRFILWLISHPFDDNVVKIFDRQSFKELLEVFQRISMNDTSQPIDTIINKFCINNKLIRIPIPDHENPQVIFSINNFAFNNLVELQHICNVKILFDTVQFVYEDLLGQNYFQRISNPMQNLLQKWKNHFNRSMADEQEASHPYVFFISTENDISHSNNNSQSNLNIDHTSELYESKQDRAIVESQPEIPILPCSVKNLLSPVNGGSRKMKSQSSYDNSTRLPNYAIDYIMNNAIDTPEKAFAKSWISNLFGKFFMSELTPFMSYHISKPYIVYKADQDKFSIDSVNNVECILTKNYLTRDTEYQIDIFLKNELQKKPSNTKITSNNPVQINEEAIGKMTSLKEGSKAKASPSKLAAENMFHVIPMNQEKIRKEKILKDDFSSRFVAMNEQSSEVYEFTIKIWYLSKESGRAVPSVVSMTKKLKEILKIYTSEYTQKKNFMNCDKISLDVIKEMAEYFVKTVSQSNQNMFSFFYSDQNLSQGTVNSKINMSTHMI